MYLAVITEKLNCELLMNEVFLTNWTNWDKIHFENSVCVILRKNNGKLHCTSAGVSNKEKQRKTLRHEVKNFQLKLNKCVCTKNFTYFFHTLS